MSVALGLPFYFSPLLTFSRLLIIHTPCRCASETRTLPLACPGGSVASVTPCQPTARSISHYKVWALGFVELASALEVVPDFTNLARTDCPWKCRQLYASINDGQDTVSDTV
jgi:hypothetical protein